MDERRKAIELNETQSEGFGRRKSTVGVALGTDLNDNEFVAGAVRLAELVAECDDAEACGLLVDAFPQYRHETDKQTTEA